MEGRDCLSRNLTVRGQRGVLAGGAGQEVGGFLLYFNLEVGDMNTCLNAGSCV